MIRKGTEFSSRVCRVAACTPKDKFPPATIGGVLFGGFGASVTMHPRSSYLHRMAAASTFQQAPSASDVGSMVFVDITSATLVP